MDYEEMHEDTGMNQFPPDFDRKPCEDELKKNQLGLLRKTRGDFYKTFTEARDNCERSIRFEFPKKLWHQHRKTITEEILFRFGQIKVTNCAENEATLTITTKEKIAEQIKAVTIEFMDL